MLNFGLTSLRLVTPQEAPLHPKAVATAAGAERILEQATLYNSLAEAITDCHHVWGTTAEPRDMIKPYMPPRTWAQGAYHAAGHKAVVFGPERTGLSNEDLTLCHALITIPVNKDFSSLNLAQALVVVAYEWLNAADAEREPILAYGSTTPATQAELDHFLKSLEAQLDAVNYWRVPSKKAIMWRNLRNIFTRAQLGSQEVRTLRGMVGRLRG
jgi:tRNA/rRNA methyltransferase